MTYGNSSNYPCTIAVTRDALDFTKNMLDILWDLIKKSRNIIHISINIAKIDGELVITIIDKKKIKRFKNTDIEKLMDTIRAYFK